MKKIFIMSCVVFFISTCIVSAENNVVSVNNVEQENYLYSSTIYNLVFDFGIISEGNDSLTAISLKNFGNAKSENEIVQLSLWKDDGNNVYDGFGVDELVKNSNYYFGQNWYFDELESVLDSGTNRFYITTDLKNNGETGKIIQFGLPTAEDINDDGLFDVGDYGVFLESGVVLSEELLNESLTRYKSTIGDYWAPFVKINNLTDNQIVDSENYIIIGESIDSGGAGMDYVKICVNSECIKTETDNFYETWTYDWVDLVNGDYAVYFIATDNRGNETITDPITVTVAIPDEEEENTDIETGQGIEVVESEFTSGRWVKALEHSAVYFLDNDNLRHSYPTQTIWESYFGDDFSFIEEITLEELQGYDLGKNVPFAEGSLIKILSSKKVYKVGSDRIIQWVKTAEVAESLFGRDWGSQVRDLPSAFWPDYEVGEPIE